MAYTDSFTDLENALWDMFNQVLGHSRIYFERTNFVRPDEDYVTIRIAELNPLEREGVVLGNSPTEAAKTYLNYEVYIDVKAHRGQSNATVSLLRHALSMPELRRVHLNDNNIGYLRSTTISDVSTVRDEEHWENRHAFVCVFHVQIVLDDVFGTDGAIETVLTTETIHDTIRVKYDGDTGVKYLPELNGEDVTSGEPGTPLMLDLNCSDDTVVTLFFAQAGEPLMQAGEPLAQATPI